MESDKDNACLERAHVHTLEILKNRSNPILPESSTLQAARSSLLEHIPEHGLGCFETTNHLLHDIAPGLNASSLSANYYGFVTGGVTPAAMIADHLVSTYDQNLWSTYRIKR